MHFLLYLSIFTLATPRQARLYNLGRLVFISIILVKINPPFCLSNYADLLKHSDTNRWQSSNTVSNKVLKQTLIRFRQIFEAIINLTRVSKDAHNMKSETNTRQQENSETNTQHQENSETFTRNCINFTVSNKVSEAHTASLNSTQVSMPGSCSSRVFCEILPTPSFIPSGFHIWSVVLCYTT